MDLHNIKTIAYKNISEVKLNDIILVKNAIYYDPSWGYNTYIENIYHCTEYHSYGFNCVDVLNPHKSIHIYTLNDGNKLIVKGKVIDKAFLRTIKINKLMKKPPDFLHQGETIF